MDLFKKLKLTYLAVPGCTRTQVRCASETPFRVVPPRHYIVSISVSYLNLFVRMIFRYLYKEYPFPFKVIAE